MPRRERKNHDDGQEHRNAKHLGQHCVVADLRRDAVARADDLRDVVDGAAEEDARLCGSSRAAAIDGIKDHRDRGQHGDARDGEDELASDFRRAEDGRDSNRGRCAADGSGAAREDAKRHRCPRQRRDSHAEGEGSATTPSMRSPVLQPACQSART